MKISKDKFYGVLVGGVIGDCLGAPFESVSSRKGIRLERILRKIETVNKMMNYTDDTAMSKSVCYSLLKCRRFDPVDMSLRFAKDFQQEPFRGYGGNVKDIFKRWNQIKITTKNVYRPSEEQFDGTGSYGNGAAMRASPIALFAKNLEETISIAKDVSKLTHAHKYGYLGGILQAVAVHEVLQTENIQAKDFIKNVQDIMKNLESNGSKCFESANDSLICEKDEQVKGQVELDEYDQLSEYTRSSTFSFIKQLDQMKKLLDAHDKNPTEGDVEYVIKTLGCDVSAQQAVPTALYCFLRNLNQGFRKTLYYAISVGGDTDTIASMCCSLAGGYYGFNNIPQEWIDCCEGVDEMKNYAEQLYEIYLSNFQQ